ncbi:hypothetical protein [Enterobacter phage vB-EclM_KMB17]|nr:hypothetical protein [Enterobacter phage vB-EclM_KMB17]
MRFGLTVEHKNLLKQLKIVNNALGRRKFALWPTRIVDGSYIWLEKYYEIRHEHVHQNEDGSYECEAYYGVDMYAYTNSREVRHKFYKKRREKGLYSMYNSTYDAIYGEEAKTHLLQYKAELEEKISRI